VRTRPFDTVQNNADNSLSLRFCSSWFEISMFFLLCSRPRHGAFHEEASARQSRRTVNELHGTPDLIRGNGAVCSLHRPDGFGQRTF
jgi:hypothetical protein